MSDEWNEEAILRMASDPRQGVSGDRPGMKTWVLDPSLDVPLDVQEMAKAIYDGLGDNGVVRIHADSAKDLWGVAASILTALRNPRRE